ncbi:MAG: HNH endonuclease [Oscillospiraceae bacterium]
MFNPRLEIGEEINNARLCEIFGCSPQGGMRKSNKTNTLVIVSDYTRGIYHDKWIAGVLHYTGMGLSGDQDINYMQNRTLNESDYNGVDVHLFEVMDPTVYTYCGRIKLVGKPYTEIQPDQDGIKRKVWMFPVQPVPDNDVVKPNMYVFKDMEDYKSRGANVDKEYAAYLATKKKGKKAVSYVAPVVPKPEPKPVFIVPADVVGKQVKHTSFGIGTITAIEGTAIAVQFDKVGLKKMGYEFCMQNKMLEFI